MIDYHVFLVCNWEGVQRAEYRCYHKTLSTPNVFLRACFLSMYIYNKGKIGIESKLNTVSFNNNTHSCHEEMHFQ